MRRDSDGQSARKATGLRSEALVRRVLSSDPKVARKYVVRISRARGKVPGLDVKLYPKVCRYNPDSKACRPIEFEVKSVEKLFEFEKSRDWPHTRDSRFVLKMHERPECYVFVTDDEVSNHTIVDFVKSDRIFQWRSRFGNGTRRPKLPVRALPALRKSPCPYVTRSHYVLKRGK